MHTALLALHFLGLALGVGAGFAQLTLTLATRDLPPAERGAFALRAQALAKNGSYGLVLLIVTGASLTVLRGVGATFQWGGPAFHAKLTLVVLMLVVLGYSQVVRARARRTGTTPDLVKLRRLSRVQLLLGMLVVICATIAFK